MNRNNSRKSLTGISTGSRDKGGPKSDRSKSNKSDNSAKYQEPHKNMMSAAMNSKFVLNTRTINRDNNNYS